MRVHLIRLMAVSVAVATAILMARLISPISAQSLGAPTFTPAQQSAGDAIYQESCASCHGKNLDDGEFGPPLKGVEFRSAWFGRSADVVFAKIETMPPAAPGSLSAEKHADLLAFLMSQNQLIASARPLPSDLDRLRTMLLPGATGGPSGGLSPNAVLPPAPPVVNPLDTYTPVTDAMLQTPPAGEWPTWRRGYDGQGFSPLKQINKDNVGTLRATWSWSLPNGPNESTPLFHDGVLFVHAYGDKVQAIDATTGDCCGHTRDDCRWAHLPPSSERLRSTVRTSMWARRTHISWRSTPGPAAWSGTSRLPVRSRGTG